MEWINKEATLPVKVIWFSKEKGTKLKSKLKEHLDVHCEHISINKKPETSLYYEETLYEAFCRIHLKKPLPECIDYLSRLWCTPNYESQVPLPQPQWWVQIEFAVYFKADFPNIHKHIAIDSFSFGTLIGLNIFSEHFSSSSPVETNGTNLKITQIVADFIHDQQELVIYFIVFNSEKKKKCPESFQLFCLKVTYTSISKILIYTNSKTPLNVIFQLSHPPFLYTVHDDAEDKRYISLNDIGPELNWTRVTDLGGSHHHSSFTLPFLKLKFKKKEWEALSNMVISGKFSRVYFSPINTVQRNEKIQNPSVPSENFDCIYALRSIASFSSDVSDQLALMKNHKDFNQALAKYASLNSKALAEALYEIQLALDRGNVILFDSALKNCFDFYNNYNEGRKSVLQPELSKSMARVRRGILTPSRLILLYPLPTFKNRLIRTCNPDYLLRISLKDENFKKLSFHLRGTEESKEEFINSTIKGIILKGIKIGPRHYEFVGCSVSQLRDHGLWMYAKDPCGRTAKDIRDSVGDLSSIKNPAKYLARLGQMLSQALGFYVVPQDCTNINNPEEDITGGMRPDSDEPYVFSDGIGKISLPLAEKVYKALNIDVVKPSALQIRYGGCKGMLTIDPNLEGEKIIFRKSMKKFESTNTSLEILKTSKPRMVFLNRPFITILEQLGIEIEVFNKLQKEMMHKLTRSLMCDADAADILQLHSQFRVNFEDSSCSYVPCKKSFCSLFKSGIQLSSEPFFRGLIQAIFKKSVGTLKSNAHIQVPADKGRNMLGVLDETGLLEYGQVFVQYSKDLDNYFNNKTIVHTGTVLVTKNPCLHPGDVRKFTAVDLPQLHHIKDCIVFPAKGKRPHPDEMAGSDLDGDEYTVIWMEDLIFKIKNYDPMLYPSSKTSNEGKNVEVMDIIDFLCRYILNDHVGILGSAHLAWADKESIFSTVCLNIARKNAINLDFAKTAKIEKLLPKEKVKCYPDFMDKFFLSNTYISRKALGVLYRSCKRFEICADALNEDVEYYYDSDFQVEGWELYKENAKQALQKYSEYVKSFLLLYAINNEGEFLSGSLTNFSKYLKEKSEANDLPVILECHVKDLFAMIRELFFSEFLVSQSMKELTSEYPPEVYKKASAWYIITYIENKGQSVPCFGLPWAVADILAEIKEKALSKNTVQSLEQRLNEKLKIFGFSNEENDKQLNKLSCINNLHFVLYSWLAHNREFLLLSDKEYRSMRTSLSTIIESLTCEYLSYSGTSEDHFQNTEYEKKFSVGHYVLQCLEYISQTYYFENDSFSLSERSFTNFGMLALITLLKLSSTLNIQYLGLKNNKGEPPNLIVSHKVETELIRMPLENDEFNDCIVHKEDTAKQILKHYTGVKDIHIRINLEKVFHDEKVKDDNDDEKVKDDDDEDKDNNENTIHPKKRKSHSRNEKWVVFMMVTGSKWSIEQFKNFITQPWFNTIFK